MDTAEADHHSGNTKQGSQQTRAPQIGGKFAVFVQHRHLIFAILLVAAIVVIVHWPALSARALSLDDNQYLTANRLVQNPGFSSAERFFGEVLKPSTVKGYYQPLTMISHMLDFAIAGGTDELSPFHRTSLCLHAANTALVIVILYLLFADVWAAAIAGLLFGIHPITVESVAWIAERKTVLSAFFSFWSLICYLLYTRNGNRRAYIASLLTYVLALLSKPTGIALPVLLLLLDYWPLNRISRKAIVEKVPLLLIGVVSAAVTIISQSRTGGIVKMPAEYPAGAIPLILCYSIRFYLNKIFWPVGLSAQYPFPRPFVLSNPDISAGVITTCVLIVILLLSLRRTRALMVGFLFFFVAILPTMQIIGFSNEIAANRFTYLPILGLLLPLSFFLGQRRSWRLRMPSSVKLRQGAIVIIVAVLAFAEARAARSYLTCWKDTLTLYSHMRKVSPDYPELVIGLARGLMEEGKTDEAIELYRDQLEVNAGYYKFLNNLGGLLAQKGEVDEAIKYFSLAAKAEPDDLAARLNLGTLFFKQNKLAEAIEQYRQAVRINPNNPDTHSKLGAALLKQGQIEDAVKEFSAALRISPNYGPARLGLNAAIAKRRSETPGKQPE